MSVGAKVSVSKTRCAAAMAEQPPRKPVLPCLNFFFLIL